MYKNNIPKSGVGGWEAGWESSERIELAVATESYFLALDV